MTWYNASWRYRVKVTVLATKVDADLTDYPIYLDLSLLPAGFHTNVNQTDARDIRVTTSDGTTEVPREVVFYTAATDTGELHFKGNVLNATNVDFYIYYGNAAASDYGVTDTYGRNNVWNSNYKHVLHLQEGGTTTANAYVDSTGNNAGGTGVATLTDSTTSPMPKGTTFDGDSAYINLGDPSDVDFGTGNFTFQAWIYPTSVSSSVEIVAKDGTDIQGGRQFEWALGNATGKIRLTIFVTALDYTFYDSNNIISTNTWAMLHAGRSANSPGGLFLYKDGAVQTFTWSNPAEGDLPKTMSSLTTPLYLGARIYTGFPGYFPGSIDEFRMLAVALTSTWISTEYNNQSSASTFFTIGTEENRPTFFLFF